MVSCVALLVLEIRQPMEVTVQGGAVIRFCVTSQATLVTQSVLQVCVTSQATLPFCCLAMSSLEDTTSHTNSTKCPFRNLDWPGYLLGVTQAMPHNALHGHVRKVLSAKMLLAGG